MLSSNTQDAATNPLLRPFDGPFGLPPFGAAKAAHFRPAFEAALAAERREIDAVADNPEPPTFTNTIEAMERVGDGLRRLSSMFFNLAGTDADDELRAIELELAPRLARHENETLFNGALFRRIDRVFHAGATLSAEQARVLERYHIYYSRHGAGLDDAAKARLSAISERLAELGTRFGQNVLADERDYALFIDEGDLAGLPGFVREAAAAAATERGQSGRYAITISRSSIEPFLQFSTRRDLREEVFRAWAARGETAGRDNRPLIAEMVALRAERAGILGHPSFAHFQLADTMAETPEAAFGLLRSVWPAARRRALEETAALEDLARADGGNFDIAPWDWRFYTERRRRAEFDLDEEEIKPYFQLERMIEAAFDVAHRLFGLSFKERHDLDLYNPEVRAFEVTDADGTPVGLFLGDYFARPSKHSGAWMSGFRDQERLAGNIRPIIVNVTNFSKPGEGAPALLSFDDARTLFHEFGHALHGLLSDVTYPTLSGTSVTRDFVEFPSQLYEHWLEQPEVLGRFAVHAGTGEPIPAPLLGRLLAARTFNQGFATVEYTSSALVDLELHSLAKAENLDVGAFETRALAEIDMPASIIMRHRPPHFGHIFSGGYAAAYYSYLWSEVLDADGFGAFEEAGDIFDPATAKRLREFVYSAGNLRKPAEAYLAFRGRAPDPASLLRRRGLAEAPAADA
jgi:peptidyl-dipeptidase Dcp